jgi:hypothetical protein
MENNDKKPSAIWSFLNSNFGLFICSSVFITFISWSYNQLQLSTKGKIERDQTIQKLITEIKYRNILLASRIDDYYYHDDSLNYYVIDQVRIVFEGDIEELSGGKMEATGFTPIFPEYAKRGLINLYWELTSYSEKESKEISDTHTKGLVKFNLDIQRLLKNDLDTDESTSMEGGDIAQLDSIIKVFTNHIDSTYF